MMAGDVWLLGIGFSVGPFTVFDILGFSVAHRDILLRRCFPVSSSPVYGSGGFSGRVFHVLSLWSLQGLCTPGILWEDRWCRLLGVYRVS